MKTWQEIGFQIEHTGDGSPSLRLIQSLREDRENGEAMHHSGGAAAETELIYGQLIKEAFARLERPQFCVVGLGLGYIEFLIARESLLAQKAFKIVSYESVPELRQYFLAIVKRETEDLPKEVLAVYQEVQDVVLKDAATLSREQICQSLWLSYQEQNFILKEALDVSTPLDWQAHIYLYDAFSSKTTPHLWEEEFIGQFLNKTSLRDAALATYAAKASLKRALAVNEFQVINKPGFMGKRNSIQGRRGVFSAETSLHTPQSEPETQKEG